METKSRTETGQTEVARARSRLPKTHQDYWKPKLKKRSYLDRSGVRVEVPEWQVRMFYLGREAWFNLDTANQAAAAIKARDIYLSLVSAGWEATLARFKPDPAAKAEICKVGEFLVDVITRSHLKRITVHRYAVKLRKLVADIANVDAGLKKKAKQRKYDYASGGRKAWLASIETQSLAVLTPDAIALWRNRYVAKAGNNPVTRKSAERSAASVLRCSRALFAPDVLSSLKVKLPPNPFAGVKLKDPGPQRYRSEVGAEWILTCAERELREAHRDQYLAVFLSLVGGLRRKETDLLLWEQIDLQNGRIHIRRTAFFEPKTDEGERVIDLVPDSVNVLRSFKESSKSKFVLNGGDPNPAASYDYYRCDDTWRKLLAWLRSKGVRQTKAIHMLRKESGSLIASEFGIEAARQHLGHRDIRTTSAHYVEKKKRIAVTIGVGLAVVAS